jgi:hypothetical protein
MPLKLECEPSVPGWGPLLNQRLRREPYPKWESADVRFC